MINEAYSSYLDIVLTATESSAGLMCACLPLTMPLVRRVGEWTQKKRGSKGDDEDGTPLTDTPNMNQQNKRASGKPIRVTHSVTVESESDLDTLRTEKNGKDLESFSTMTKI